MHWRGRIPSSFPHEELLTLYPATAGSRLRTAVAAVAAFVAVQGAGAIAVAQTPAPAPAGLRAEAERLRREERLPEALAAYRALVAAEPTGFEDRFWVAKLESWTGALDAAERGLVALLAERPEDYDSRIALADVRRWRGDTAGARVVLDDLRRGRPEDPEVLQRLAALEPGPAPARWEADLQYLGERLSSGAAGDGATVSLRPTSARRVRWLAAATVQNKFERTEARAGGELGWRLSPSLEVSGSVRLAPGAEVLPRQSYGLGLTRPLARGVVLAADYDFDRYHDAGVHALATGLELYAGRWLIAGRYRYTATRFDGADALVGDHAGSASVGWQYGAANLVRVFAAAGGEAFSQPSR
ncbi:MAG TPA: YaiO family outer membrane beta-barrel protein, partial [Gemmatimonadales bacterium]|nr:YaiO family outer membrane beta-barrel protein [Gemmatimonadales bacterium]